MEKNVKVSTKQLEQLDGLFHWAFYLFVDDFDTFVYISYIVLQVYVYLSIDNAKT